MSRAELRKLPDGWKWVRLGEVIAEAQPGFACGERDPNGLIQLRMNNVDTRGNFVWNEFIRVPFDKNQIEKYELIEDDVLFNNTNSVELVGKSALFLGHTEPVVYSNHFTRIRVDRSKIFAAYLASWLIYQWNSKTFERICNRWIGQSAVKNEKLLSLSIPLPPLPEQKRIAAILNEQMAAVEKARAAAEAQREAAKALCSTYLRKVFKYRTGDKLPQGWRWVRLEEIGEFLSGGTPAKEEARYWNGNIPFVTGADITELYISENNARAFLTEEGLNSGKTAVCQKGTVLFVTRTRVGRIGIANCLLGASQDLSPYICSGKILPEFLCRYINNISEYLIVNCRGATIKGLTRDFVENISIPLPQFSEQKRITTNLKEKMLYAENLQSAILNQQSVLDALPQAFLRKSFRGEL